MRTPAQFRRPDWLLLQGAAALALLFGLYARFKGLGQASIAPDEYYIVRSVENILRSGLPQYLCGGYYPRAIAFQYLVAGLSAGGLPIDVVARWVAAAAGVIGLPAAWLLGCRVGGRAAGLAVLIALAVSLWEVEIARFGRMYTPFQAVFLWYAWVYVRVTIDGERRLLWPLFGLAVLGTLTWEGGVLLAMTGVLVPFILSPQGRFGRREWAFIAANGLLFIGTWSLLISNLRLVGGEPPFPPNFDPDAAREVNIARIGRTQALWTTLSAHRAWLIAGVVPAVLAALALRLPWRLRARWPAAAALCIALFASMLHQFALTAAVLLVALLLGLIDRKDLWQSTEARLYWLAIALCTVFWLAYGLTASDWQGSQHIEQLRDHAALRVFYELTRFPDLLTLFVVPWLRAVPMLTALLVLGVGAALIRHLRAPSQPRSAERVLLLLAVSLLAAAGLSEPPRIETRYVFFLYPLLLVLAFGAVAHLGERFSPARREATPALLAVALALFMLTEDFRPGHLATIDSPEATLRTDLTPKLATHVVDHTDVRGAATWLARNAAPGMLIVNAFPSADYYFRHFSFAYLDQSSPRFIAYSCRQGTYERWGNLPLVHSTEELQKRVARSGGAYIVSADTTVADLTSALAAFAPRVRWRAADGQLVVLAVGAEPR